MSNVQAKVLYDFDGRSSDELTIKEGQVIKVLDQENYGEWWLATNSSGAKGIVPAVYVEIICLPEPSRPPPPLPKPSFKKPVDTTIYSDSSSWDGEFSDEDDIYSPNPHSNAQTKAVVETNLRIISRTNNTIKRKESSNSSLAIASPAANAKAQLIRKSMSRYSKLGVEEYLSGLESLGQLEVSQRKEAKIIEDSPNCFKWCTQMNKYAMSKCVLKDFKKESKMHGFKSYIAYTISFGNDQEEISHRYKQFDWLYKRLVDKFPCVCVPALPDKQVTNRYENDFIKERKRGLQQWLNRIIAHPVLGASSVIKLFFLSTKSEKKWKDGKREIEADPTQGIKFFCVVDAQPKPNTNYEAKLEESKNMLTATQSITLTNTKLLDTFVDFNKKQCTSFYDQYVKVSKIFGEISKAFKNEPHSYHNQLSSMYQEASGAYLMVADLFKLQPHVDGEQFVDEIQEYTGINASVLPILQLHRHSAKTGIDLNNSLRDQTITQDDASIVDKRLSIMLQGCDAEYNYLCECRNRDYKAMLFNYLKFQRDFYAKVTQKFTIALEKFNNIS